MSNRIEKFKKRQTIKKQWDTERLYLMPDEELVQKHLHSGINHDLVKNITSELDDFYNIDKIEGDLKVSDKEVKELLTILKREFDEQKFNALLAECKATVIQSIVTPFGIGWMLSKFDKDGGNVDTIHNVRQGIYATEEEKAAYNNRGEYNPDLYHKNEKYIHKNKMDAEKQKSGELYDSYTGKKLSKNEDRDLDHIISAKEIHDDPGRVLAEIEGSEIANEDSNLHSTTRTINRSKKQKSADDFAEYLEKTKSDRQHRIDELTNKTNLTDKERKELQKLKELEDIDIQKLKKSDQKARKEYEKKVNKTYYTSEKFIKNTIKTGINEGIKMGIQQSIGLLLTEFFSATFDELMDIYIKGFDPKNKGFIEILKERLSHIASRIANKWKDVCSAFSHSFISGFLSNLITVVINMFVTTGRKIVHIIREGFLSLLRAIKLICLPPENMTLPQAAHEASKLIATGLTTIVGIAVEESIDIWIKGTVFLEPIADIITTILVGALTGIATTFVVYLIDKIDFFNANKKEEDKYIITVLGTKIDETFKEAEELIEGEKLQWQI